MAISLKFYHDSALTSEITALNPLTATADVAGGLPAVDKTIYLGSTVTGNKFQASSDPGTDPIIVDIVDANAGTGAPDTQFKLALSSGGLASATAGASLTLSHTILSGVANAVPVYTRRTSALTTSGSYTDITLETNTVIETPV
jgi:hypothetical protein